MKSIKNSFPTVESPSRCHLSIQTGDIRILISCNNQGDVFSSLNRKEWEEWYILMDHNSGTVRFKNCTHGGYLICNSIGHISTGGDDDDNDDSAKWQISMEPNKHTYSIKNVKSGRYLNCQNEEFHGRNHNKGDGFCWYIEFLTGELGFLTSVDSKKQLKCDPTSGKLSLTENWEGWEVWRFVEAGEGHIRIMSWHDNHFLLSDRNGKVSTTDNMAGDWEKWEVDLAPGRFHGVTIKSVSHGRYLQVESDNTLSTTEFFKGGRCIWHVSSANRRNFFLSSPTHDKRIGCTEEKIQSTRNRKDWEVWELVTYEGDGLVDVALRSRKFGTYICSDQDGNLYQGKSFGVNALWKIQSSSNRIVSKASGRYLSCDGDKLSTSNHPGPSEQWCLEPVMPITCTASQMRNKIFGYKVAAISIIAAPFAVVGAIGALGFGAGGIAAGSAAAGMMSAEAIAAGGTVVAGGTVATLQSIGAVGLGFAGTAASMSAGAVVGASAVGISEAVSTGHQSRGESTETTVIAHNRPFCDWESW